MNKLRLFTKAKQDVLVKHDTSVMLCDPIQMCFNKRYIHVQSKCKPYTLTIVEDVTEYQVFRLSFGQTDIQMG